MFLANSPGAGPLSYRRFATAAEAVRFAVEELPAVRTLGARMQVGEERFNGDDIRRLYESASYPRRRRLRELKQVVKMKASANVGSPAVRNHLPCDQ